MTELPFNHNIGQCLLDVPINIFLLCHRITPASSPSSQVYPSMAASSSTTLFLVFSSLLIFASLCHISEADYSAPIKKGLSWDFHHKSCQKVEKIVRKHLKKVFKEDIGQAAGLVRLHFHDCFVQVLFMHVLFYPLISKMKQNQ